MEKVLVFKLELWCGEEFLVGSSEVVNDEGRFGKDESVWWIVLCRRGSCDGDYWGFPQRMNLVRN